MNNSNTGYLTGWKPGETLHRYILYDWLGKIKWCYLCGIYLVDPKYEQEFMKEHRVH